MKLKQVYSLVFAFIFFSCASPTEQGNINGGSSVDLLPNLNIEDGIEIVTWNIEFFPKLGQRTMDSVQKIIKSLNADIYCLQEISSRNSFEELAESLTDYDFVISEDTDYLNLVVLYKKNDFVVRSQSSLFTDSVYEFAYRPPLRLEMTYLGQNAFDFTIINMHLKCCDNGYDRRKASVDILHDYLNSSVQSGIVNHIVVGDWNDDISDSYNQNSFNIFLEDNDNYRYVTYDNAHSNTNIYDSFPSYPSFIDHIMISADLFEKEGSGDVQTIRLGDYISGYDEIISDHRPVVWRFVP
jgi:endonuclease/exonuclease/phosphatase family metal-dependent hydrolase